MSTPYFLIYDNVKVRYLKMDKGYPSWTTSVDKATHFNTFKEAADISFEGDEIVMVDLNEK